MHTLPEEQAQKPKLPRRVLNLALAGTASLAGFVAVIITFASLYLGLWLDAQLGTQKLYTVIVIVLSVPVSLLVMFAMVVGLVRQIVPQPLPHRKHRQLTDVEEEPLEIY